MAEIVGTYNLTVGAKDAWVLGPIVMPGEALRVVASGETAFFFRLKDGSDQTGGFVLTDGQGLSDYQFPEGGYVDGTPYDPTLGSPELTVPASLFGFGFVCAGAPPLGLALVVLPDGVGPPPDQGVTALRPNRLADLSAQAIFDFAGPAEAYRCWLRFNKGISPLKNLGSYAVEVIRFEGGGSLDMSDRFTINQQVQIGKETTPGQAVPCPIRLRTVAVTPAIKTEFKKHRSEGNKRADTITLSKEWTECTLDGIATYTEIGYLLSSLVSVPVSAAQGSGVYQHLFSSATSAADALQSYTMQFGSTVGCEQSSYSMVQGLTFKMTRDDVHMTGTTYGQKLLDSVNDGVNLTAGANDVQAVAITGGPTGGTFALGFKGAWTAPIAFGSAASAVQTALALLPTVGSSGLTVATASSGYTVTFGGPLGSFAQPLLQANASGLTGGTTPNITVTKSTQGGLTELWKIPILPGDVRVYLAGDYSSLGSSSSKLLRAFSSDWSLGDRTKPFWVQDADAGGYSGFAEGEPKEKLDLLLEADAVGMALRQAYRAGQVSYLRIDMTSSTYMIGTTSTPHRLTLDAAVKVANVKEFKDEQGIYALGFELQMVPDPALGCAYRLTLVNGVSGY